MLDDGTCARLDDETFRVTSAAPAYWWLMRHADPYQVEVVDRTGELAALALQGPTSRELLRQVCDADMDALRFFGITEATFDGYRGWVSRTGYTGDLGYEVWVPNAHAIPLWDDLMSTGKNYGIEAVGLDAMDISRIEAGFVLRGVDYTGANDAHIDAQKSTPFELGLDWTVKLQNREPFIGQAALEREKRAGSRWSFVGLDIDWCAIEALYNEHGLPPHAPVAAAREEIQNDEVGRRDPPRLLQDVDVEPAPRVPGDRRPQEPLLLFQLILVAGRPPTRTQCLWPPTCRCRAFSRARPC